MAFVEYEERRRRGRLVERRFVLGRSFGLLVGSLIVDLPTKIHQVMKVLKGLFMAFSSS